MSSDALLVLTTCASTQEAADLAAALVEQRLAACVSALAGVVSTYRWQSRVQHDEEVLVVVKTTQARYEAIERLIQKQTSYELPEIIAVPVHRGSSEYLKWLTASVSPEE